MFSILSRGTTMKIKFCPFCVIPAISIAVHTSATTINF